MKYIENNAPNIGAIFTPKSTSKVAFIGAPNSICHGYSKDNKIDKTRVYGPDGYTLYDYDFTDHGNSKIHNFPEYNGAHKHKYTIINGVTIDKTTEKLTDEEYEKYIKPYLNKNI